MKESIGYLLIRLLRVAMVAALTLFTVGLVWRDEIAGHMPVFTALVICSAGFMELLIGDREG